MENEPPPSEVALPAALPDVVMATTEAPGMTAPVGSATWPWIPPVVPLCPHACPVPALAVSSATTAIIATQMLAIRAERALLHFKRLRIRRFTVLHAYKEIFRFVVSATA